MLLQTRRFELEVAHGHIFARLSGWGEVLPALQGASVSLKTAFQHPIRLRHRTCLETWGASQQPKEGRHGQAELFHRPS